MVAHRNRIAEPIVADRFALLRPLGAGGMGSVWLAEDLHTGKLVAIKSAHSDASSRQRLAHEFQRLSCLNHRNLVRVQELVCTEDRAYIVMEAVVGVDFVSFLRLERVDPQLIAQLSTLRSNEETAPMMTFRWARAGQSCPSMARVAAAFGELSEGVHALHRGKIVHRDLKPSNVLTTASGRAVILDFGLAGSAGLHTGRAPSGCYGTGAYAAPEVLNGDGPTSASDCYSMGVMLYEALTGMHPQEHGSFWPECSMPGTPGALYSLCADLLSKSPDDRPTSREVVAACAELAPRGAMTPEAPPCVPGACHIIL